MGMKETIRRALNWFGFDIVRLHRSAKRTLLGLTALNIRTVIDVGANEGQFARMISRFFPQAELFCFEPLEEPFRKLSVWAQTQGGRVRCFQTALGDWEGEAAMHLHVEHTPSSSLLPTTEVSHRLYPQTKAERIVRVPVSTLDRVLGGVLDHMARDILLKLDVQGFEDRVLRGASRTLAASRAVLLEISVEPLYEGQADFRGLVDLLYQAGFRYAGNLEQAFAGDGRVVWLDAVFVRGCL